MKASIHIVNEGPPLESIWLTFFYPFTIYSNYRLKEYKSQPDQTSTMTVFLTMTMTFQNLNMFCPLIFGRNVLIALYFCSMTRLGFKPVIIQTAYEMCSFDTGSFSFFMKCWSKPTIKDKCFYLFRDKI